MRKEKKLIRDLERLRKRKVSLKFLEAIEDVPDEKRADIDQRIEELFQMVETLRIIKENA